MSAKEFKIRIGQISLYSCVFLSMKEEGQVVWRCLVVDELQCKDNLLRIKKTIEIF